YAEGAAAMTDAFEALGDEEAEYDIRQPALNRLGYALLRRVNRPDAAIAIFEIAAQRFPDSANAHDSLGEAYRAAGRIDDAIKSYERALAIDPDMPSAIAAISEMKI
ncbi:MAG: tetratricopeptide repeat protein, partial [Pseudomonadota bacterium]